jgi:hypothetical protein
MNDTGGFVLEWTEEWIATPGYRLAMTEECVIIVWRTRAEMLTLASKLTMTQWGAFMNGTGWATPLNDGGVCRCRMENKN